MSKLTVPILLQYKFGTSVSWERNRRFGVALATHQTIVLLPPTGSRP